MEGRKISFVVLAMAGLPTACGSRGGGGGRGIVDHSDILLDERYAEAWEYKDNPFIYVSIIGPIYATGRYDC